MRILLVSGMGLVLCAPVGAYDSDDCQKQVVRSKDETCQEYLRAPARPLTESTPPRKSDKCPPRRILM